ncbi:super-infection exclusion protein B [Methylophaga sp.]|uniref:super-infection exclusion protein B n=1 Tax=Methylophaga sp. TaxID=2024840 RepID=UPI001770AF55|nr:super-infection exclusion protein B [Methylophaga sp.]HIC45643.1 hypothetical protein [Methylophaga sp.]
MEWLLKIVDLAKIPTKFIGSIAVVCAIVLLLPEPALEKVALLQLREDFGQYFGLCLLVSSSILLVELGIRVYRRVRAHYAGRWLRQHIREHLNRLDVSEKAVLREFFLASARTIKLPIEQPAVSSLMNAGVLEQSSTLGSRTTVGSIFSVSLSDETEAHLNPEHVDIDKFVLHTDDGKWYLNEEGQQWVLNNRPSFMRKLQRHLAIMEGRFW